MSKVLKKEYRDKILKDLALAAAIGEELHKSGHTVLRYARANDGRLTQAGVVEVIRKQLGLSQETEVLEDREVEPAAV